MTWSCLEQASHKKKKTQVSLLLSNGLSPPTTPLFLSRKFPTKRDGCLNDPTPAQVDWTADGWPTQLLLWPTCWGLDHLTTKNQWKIIKVYIGLSPCPGFQSPPGLWTIFRIGDSYKPSFATVAGGTTQGIQQLHQFLNNNCERKFWFWKPSLEICCLSSTTKKWNIYSSKTKFRRVHRILMGPTRIYHTTPEINLATVNLVLP